MPSVDRHVFTYTIKSGKLAEVRAFVAELAGRAAEVAEHLAAIGVTRDQITVEPDLDGGRLILVMESEDLTRRLAGSGLPIHAEIVERFGALLEPVATPAETLAVFRPSA